jgi:NCS2 family nucleobase:cation symporter-2
MLMHFFGNSGPSSTPEISAWISLPQGLPFGTPQFQLEPILLMSLVYGVVLVETIGTWYVVGTVMNRSIDENLVNRGGFGEGLGCLVAAVLGSTPVTGYAANAGILSMTRNYSRWVGITVGAQLLLIGLMPKLIRLLASIPTQAMLGVFLAACGVIAYNGYLLIQKLMPNKKNPTPRIQAITWIPVVISIVVSLIPQQWLQSLPASVSPLLSSGISMGALTAIFLNRVLPDRG